jgi:hypothetical protein
MTSDKTDFNSTVCGAAVFDDSRNTVRFHSYFYFRSNLELSKRKWLFGLPYFYSAVCIGLALVYYFEFQVAISNFAANVYMP